MDMAPSDQNMRPKERPFQLVKYFAWASFIVLAIFSFLFSIVISENAIQILKASYENNVVLLGENLSLQVYRRYVYPQVVLRGSSVSLNDPRQAELMDRIVRGVIYGFNIDSVNAYDITRTQIVYSTDPGQIGLKMPESLEYKKALEGENSSMTSTEEGFWGLGMGAKVALRVYIPFRRPADPNPIERDPFQDVFQLNQGRVYVPFGESAGPDTDEKAPLLGVLELNQDMSEQNESIVRFQLFVFGLTILIMVLIFLSLLFIVHKAQGMIEQRAQKRFELLDQLHQAERLAALGEMVASVSHEIKNPLGIIRSTSELLGEMPEADETHKRLSRVITGESTRLNQIVTEFLDFARPEVPSLRDCYLEDVIERIISFTRPELEKRGIKVNHNLNDRSLRLLADQELLYRAFLNILINSMESMEDGGEIVIRVEREKDLYCIEFEDNGCGISEENADRVLKPFFTTKNKGSGLGLSIVKKIVEAHNGTLGLESREGGGTRITVRLQRTEGRTAGR
jgi:two-component system sensor histidine kinase HydH